MKKIIIIILSVFGVLFIGSAIYLTYIIKNVDYKYTGEELFATINKHRKNIGVQEIAQDPKLCSNLVDRWIEIRKRDNPHKGFNDWIKQQGLMVNGQYIPNYKELWELFVVDISTPENAIVSWLGSPGHKLPLENPEFNVGCTYADDGTGILIIGKKN